MDGHAGYESFAANMHEEIHSKALDESNPHFREEVFTEYVVALLYDRGLANNADICHAEIKAAGSKPAGKISAWTLSSDGTTLDLFVSLHHGVPVEETPVLGKTDIQRQLNLGIGFLKRCLEGIVQSLEESSPGFVAAKTIYDARETLTALNLYFLTDGLARSQDIDEQSKVGDMEVRQGTPAKQKTWAEQHPLSQKFTKTDLAKYIHAWDGLPHFVCRGAEKNFTEFARRLAEESEPVVNVTYFQRVVAKAILWRAAEAQFDELGLKSFRAVAVAYSVAWLVEKTEQRINLDAIWKRQALHQSLVDALREVLPVAREFVDEVSRRTGENPEGPPKKPTSWKEFQKRDIELPFGWKRDLASQPIVDAISDMDAIEQEWARLCRHHGNDTTLLSNLYTPRGKRAPTKIGSKTMSVLSAYPKWDNLREQPFDLTIAKFKLLVEVVSAAAQQGELNESTDLGHND